MMRNNVAILMILPMISSVAGIHRKRQLVLSPLVQTPPALNKPEFGSSSSFLDLNSAELLRFLEVNLSVDYMSVDLSMSLSMSMSMLAPVDVTGSSAVTGKTSPPVSPNTIAANTMPQAMPSMTAPITPSGIMAPASSPHGNLVDVGASTSQNRTSAILCTDGDDISDAPVTSVTYSYHYNGISADTSEISNIDKYVLDSVASSLCGSSRRELRGVRVLVRAVDSAGSEITGKCDGEFCSVVTAELRVVMDSGDDVATVDGLIAEALSSYSGEGSVQSIDSLSSTSHQASAAGDLESVGVTGSGTLFAVAVAGVCVVAGVAIFLSGRHSRSATECVLVQKVDESDITGQTESVNTSPPSCSDETELYEIQISDDLEAEEWDATTVKRANNKAQNQAELLAT